MSVSCLEVYDRPVERGTINFMYLPTVLYQLAGGDQSCL